MLCVAKSLNLCLSGFSAGQERLDYRINRLDSRSRRRRHVLGRGRKLGGGPGATVRGVLGRRRLPTGHHDGMVCSTILSCRTVGRIPPRSAFLTKLGVVLDARVVLCVAGVTVLWVWVANGSWGGVGGVRGHPPSSAVSGAQRSPSSSVRSRSALPPEGHACCRMDGCPDGGWLH